MSSQEVVTLQDRNNPLLNRREIKVIIKNSQGQLSRANATSLVAGHFHLNKQQQIIPISMKSETGRTDVYASFYVYSLENAQQQLPRYVMLRNMSKEDRKKVINEEKAARLKAKQAAAAEVKSGRGKR